MLFGGESFMKNVHVADGADDMWVGYVAYSEQYSRKVV
jgi:hypothetical protein